MKKRLLALIPYAIALAIIFYALPFLIRDTGIGMLMMLLVIPMLTFICSVIYGVREGFDILLPVIVTILFAPTVFIFYNASAWGYILAYGVISLAGNGIGRIFYGKR